jgi:hypothetical protein
LTTRDFAVVSTAFHLLALWRRREAMSTENVAHRLIREAVQWVH